MSGLLKPSGRRPSTAIVLGGLLALAIVALALTPDLNATTATATGGGPEMLLNVHGGDCDDASRPTICRVGLGDQFTLSVDVMAAPGPGYILMQSFIDYGVGIAYLPPIDASGEIVWPDCNVAPLRIEFSESVHHGCSTGLLPPLPTSPFAGTVVSLSFRCPDTENSNEIKLRPYLDEVADTFGSLLENANESGIPPKVSDLTVMCSDASGPLARSTASPVSTTTASPMPTVTATPTPTATIAAQPPTETAVATATPGPAATPQATVPATAEAQPSTVTATATTIATASATITPTPTATSTFTPTPCPIDSVRVGDICAKITPTYTATPSSPAGDTSCDGMVNPLDAALILQLSAGMIPALPCPAGGDTNEDGRIDPLDASLVLQFSAGLINRLPP